MQLQASKSKNLYLFTKKKEILPLIHSHDENVGVTCSYTIADDM